MMSVYLSVCMYVCGLITQKRLNRLGSNSQRVFSLVPGWFQAKKIRIRLPVRRKTGKNRFSMVFHKWSFALFLKLQRVLRQLGGAQPHPTPNAAGCQRRSPLVIYNSISQFVLCKYEPIRKIEFLFGLLFLNSSIDLAHHAYDCSANGMSSFCFY